MAAGAVDRDSAAGLAALTVKALLRPILDAPPGGKPSTRSTAVPQAGPPVRPGVTTGEAAPDILDYRRLRPTALRDTLRRRGGAGAPPDASLRETLREPLRFDPAQARLHRGPVAADAARALGAQAFTIGRDVFFGEGRYQPASPAGLELIAHELTHVGQQARLASDQMRFFTATGGDAMEEEAQQAAARVRDVTQLRTVETSRPPVQRSEIERPAMQLARFAGGPATLGADTLMAPAAAPSGAGGPMAMPSPRLVADHVYDLMRKELAQSNKRGQAYRRG